MFWNHDNHTNVPKLFEKSRAERPTPSSTTLGKGGSITTSRRSRSVGILDVDGPPSDEFLSSHPVNTESNILADIDFLAGAGDLFDFEPSNSVATDDAAFDVDRGLSHIGPSNNIPSKHSSTVTKVNNDHPQVAKDQMKHPELKSNKSGPMTNDATIHAPVVSDPAETGRSPRGCGGAASSPRLINGPIMTLKTTRDDLCVPTSKSDATSGNNTAVETSSGVSPRYKKHTNLCSDGTTPPQGRPARTGKVDDYHHAFLLSAHEPLHAFLLDSPDRPGSTEGVAAFHESIRRTSLDLRCPICGKQHAFKNMEEWAGHLDAHINPRRDEQIPNL